MFDARPDLLDGLFNRGNQADGRQQQALAGSIAAFATYLVEKPDQLPDHLLSRVAHKHVSLGLSPDSHLVKAGSQRRVMLLHADDSPDSFPLRQQVTEDISRLPDGSLHSWFVNPAEGQGPSGNTFQGFMDVNAVELPLDAEYYLCGPLPFLQAVRSALIAKGIRAKDIQYEVFGPDLWLADFQ